MLASKINKHSKYDVIVLGGGPSGSGAAIEAGRNGAKTLLIERQYCLGGMWTSGFVNPLFDFENKTGLIKEIVSDLSQKGNWGGFWDKSFNFEYMKSILEQKCIEAGVDILYDTSYIGLESDGETIKGIYTANIDGITYYEADVFVDATGDACTVEDLGLPYSIGENNTPSTCQAMTLMFVVSGVPPKYKDGLVIYDLVQNAFNREGKGKKLNFDMPYLIPVPNSNFATIQLTHMHGFSPLCASDRTKAAIDGRRQLMEVYEALKYYDEDFKDLDLVSSAAQLGIRESRRIDGEYCITEEDIMSGAQFDDSVTTVTFGVDIHPAEGEEQHCVEVKPYQIPFRAMLPKNTVNLIVAGKTISGTHFAHASYRVTANCCAMGEAAGKAAAYASVNGVMIREVPTYVYYSK